MKKSIGAKPVVYPTPVFVVGTYDREGHPNVMTAAWGGICCSSPPCVAVSLRKATYSYGNIMNHKAFTINIASETLIREADYFGIATGKEENKFLRTGLTPVKSDLVNAPYVREFPFVLECKVRHTLEIGLHTQFVGEIMDIKAEEDVLDENGAPDIGKMRPILFAPQMQAYYGIGDYLGQAFSIGRNI
jgi:flavin reductase (DIM6/NTAB) family NADH-FMN oxidoreductase RutF